MTFTENLRGGMSGRAFRAFTVVLDGTINSITADNLGLRHLEAVTGTYALTSSAAADTHTVLLTQEAGVSKIEVAAGKASDVLNLWVIGW